MGLLRTVNKQTREDMTGVWWSTLVTSELGGRKSMNLRAMCTEILSQSTHKIYPILSILKSIL